MGLGGVIRHTAGAATTLALIIVGGLTVGQFLPALAAYMPGIATQAAVTVHRSAGLLSPGLALAVLGGTRPRPDRGIAAGIPSDA